MSILAAFSSYMYVEKSAKRDIRTKNLYVECWWNWRLAFLPPRLCVTHLFKNEGEVSQKAGGRLQIKNAAKNWSLLMICRNESIRGDRDHSNQITREGSGKVVWSSNDTWEREGVNQSVTWHYWPSQKITISPNFTWGRERSEISQKSVTYYLTGP